MKIKTLLTAWWLLAGVLTAGAEGFTRRPVFVGDSITHQGRYLGYLQLYQALHDPSAVARFVNSGCAGDSGLNLVWRFEGDIAPTAATATEYFMMLGMNDFGMNVYTTDSPDEAELRARQKRLDEFDQFNDEIYPKMKAFGRPVTLITPSPYDVYSGRNRPCLALNEKGLATLSDHVRAAAKKYGFRLIELHRPLTEFLRAKPEAIPFTTGDRVHPGEAGALLMAVEILEQLGYAEKPLTGLTVAAKDDAVDRLYTPKALPFPDLPEWRTLVVVRPETAALNREPLIVTGLAAGSYELASDGRTLGVFTAAQLARGVNLAELDTPSRRQAAEAARLIPEKRRIDNILRRICMLEQYYCKDRRAETVETWRQQLMKDPKRHAYRLGLVETWQKYHSQVSALERELDDVHERLGMAVQPRPWRLTVKPATPTFAKAKSVWPKGEEAAMNTRFDFTATFDVAEQGPVPVLKLVAWYSYRVELNGTFVAFGPARGPKGVFRADEIPLKAKPGRNELTVTVAGYNVPNFYLMNQPPFVKAEIVQGDRVLSATGVDGDFVATWANHVVRVNRYSYQRTFAEAYRLPVKGIVSTYPLAPAPEPTLIPRRVPYPDYEFDAAMKLLSTAEVRYDAKAKVRGDRMISLPGRKNNGGFKGFAANALDENTFFYGQRLVYTNRCAATAAEREAKTFRLEDGNSRLFDHGFNDTGFPGVTVKVAKPGRLVLEFDEVMSDSGEARGLKRYAGCANILVWDFEEPGDYAVESFEPYVMRYVTLAALRGGSFEIAAPTFRSYKNATAKRTSFRSSDPALVKIFTAASETFRQNAVDVFTDCPSRERAGWNCDAFFTAPVSTLLTGNTDLERVFEECLALPPAFDGIPEGMFPMCYPSDHPNGQFIPNWAMWFVLETEEYLQRSGDRETVDALKPKIFALVKYFERFRNSDGLLERLESWNFIEWSHANDLVRDVNYPANMAWAAVLESIDRLYGRPDLADEAKRIRATVLKQSWTGQWFCDNAVRQKDGSLKLSGDCTETCQYYAFFFGTATKATHPALWKTLMEDFGPRRYDPADRRKLLKYPEIFPSNAFIGNYLRLKLLERENRAQQILDETKGYFLYMAERTGTLWEHDRITASCNHGFASYVNVLLVRAVMGVSVDLLGKTVTLRETDANVAFCEVTLPVGDEAVTVTRRFENGRAKVSATVPTGWKLIRE